MTRVTSPPFTGQFNHDDMLKVYEEKLKEATSLMNTQTPEQARQMYRTGTGIWPQTIIFCIEILRGFLKTGDI